MTVITPKIHINQNQQQRQNKNKKSPSFGNAGAITNFLAGPGIARVLEPIKSNPIAEVVALDVGGMIIPRTAIDTIEQNKQYGLETFIDETVPMVFNPFGPGLVAGAMLTNKGWKGVQAGADSAKAMGEAWKESGGNSEKYTRRVLQDLTSHHGQGKSSKLQGKDLDDLAKRSAELLKNPLEPKKHKKEIGAIADTFTRITGGSSNIDLDINGKKVEGTNISRVLNDMHSLGQQMKNRSMDEVPKFINEVSDFSKKKTFWGALVSIAGMISIPYFNKKFTEARTGKKGYVAYKDFENDNAPKLHKTEKQKEQDQKKLNLMKAGSVAGILGLMVLSMGGPKTFLKPKNLMKKIELKDSMPGMDMIKLIYGSFLAARIGTSRDETEVKNRTVRDYWGFANWLVVGPLVTKGIINTLDKKILNKPKDSGFFKWGIPSFNEIRAKEAAMTAKGVGENAIKKMKVVHAGGIIGGIAYAVTALGVGLPLLNNWITNTERKKQLEAIALQQQKQKGNNNLDTKSFVSFMKNNRPSILQHNKDFNSTSSFNYYDYKKLYA